MKGNELLTVSEAAHEAGVNRSTIQRWIGSGRLKKRAAGKVKWGDVVRCRDAQRTGRPHGRPAKERAVFFSKAQETYAKPFFGGRGGLQRLKVALAGIVTYHVAAGRKDQIVNALLDAAKSASDAERVLKIQRERKRALSKCRREAEQEDERRARLGLPSRSQEQAEILRALLNQNDAPTSKVRNPFERAQVPVIRLDALSD